MPPNESSGEYLNLVVRVEVADGACRLLIDGAGGPQRLALQPATFVIRLWRAGDMALRGSISLYGTEHHAPIQSNAALERLLRAWLIDSRPPPAETVQPG